MPAYCVSCVYACYKTTAASPILDGGSGDMEETESEMLVGFCLGSSVGPPVGRTHKYKQYLGLGEREREGKKDHLIARLGIPLR